MFRKIFFEKYFSKNVFRKIFFECYIIIMIIKIIIIIIIRRRRRRRRRIIIIIIIIITQTFQIRFFSNCWGLVRAVFTGIWAREGVFQVDLTEITRRSEFSRHFDGRLSVSRPGQILAGRSGKGILKGF